MSHAIRVGYKHAIETCHAGEGTQVHNIHNILHRGRLSLFCCIVLRFAHINGFQCIK